MSKKTFLTKIIFCLPLFILGLSMGDVFASRAEFEQIKELEKQEKQAPVEQIIREVVEYKAESLSDPFIEPEMEEIATESAETTVMPLPDFSVQGVIWGGSLPQAIINEQVVKIGDTIQGAKVTSIGKEGVGLLFEGRQYNLSSPAGLPGK